MATGLRSRAGKGDASAHQTPVRKIISGMEKYNVIVIGAGPAGITSAKELKACGANVVILEAGKRIGGRILNSSESEDPEVRNFVKIPGTRARNPLQA
jgi:monoamine oxidase